MPNHLKVIHQILEKDDPPDKKLVKLVTMVDWLGPAAISDIIAVLIAKVALLEAEVQQLKARK